MRGARGSARPSWRPAGDTGWQRMPAWTLGDSEVDIGIVLDHAGVVRDDGAADVTSHLIRKAIRIVSFYQGTGLIGFGQ